MRTRTRRWPITGSTVPEMAVRAFRKGCRVSEPNSRGPDGPGDEVWRGLLLVAGVLVLVLVAAYLLVSYL
jgi:hypothetical protein